MKDRYTFTRRVWGTEFLPGFPVILSCIQSTATMLWNPSTVSWSRAQFCVALLVNFPVVSSFSQYQSNGEQKYPHKTAPRLAILSDHKTRAINNWLAEFDYSSTVSERQCMRTFQIPPYSMNAND